MRMSATCHLNKYGRLPVECSAGYTLVEILVVLAIAGMLVGVALPRLFNFYDSMEYANQRSSLLEQIEGLGYRAYTTGRGMTLASTVDEVGAAKANASTSNTSNTSKPGTDSKTIPEIPVLLMPANWRITLAKPVQYSLTGLCSGGQFTLAAPDGRKESFQLVAPLCRVTPATSSSGL
jgi:prepilin-type N-terminal cleavage/methylation domain-containing protein